MDGYRLTAKADSSVSRLYEYSVLTFGERQADMYFLGLHHAFELLVAHPEIGRIHDPRLSVRRLVHRRHTIFYTIEGDGISILDILGAGQDPDWYIEGG